MSMTSARKKSLLWIPVGAAVAVVALATTPVFAGGGTPHEMPHETTQTASTQPLGAAAADADLMPVKAVPSKSASATPHKAAGPSSKKPPARGCTRADLAAGKAGVDCTVRQVQPAPRQLTPPVSAPDAGDAGDHHHDPKPAPTPDSDEAANDHDPHHGHGHGDGPYINLAAIPASVEGHSERRLGTTDQVPGDSSRGASRTVCGYSHMNFDDAIVFPGQPGAAHLHTYFGNTGVDAFTTDESLNTSGNSTCRGGIVNRSGYWVPSVIDAHGTPLVPEDSHFYYKESYTDYPAKTSTFPSGLRILAGAEMSEPHKPSRHTRYTCRGVTPYEAFDHIPDCEPGTQVTMTIHFPHCWVGEVNGAPVLDSVNHRDHMAYGSGGACPDTHPVKIPAITFNILYTVPPGGTSGWRLSSDTYDADLPAGYSLHGDWIAGWEDDVMEQIVAECLNARKDCQSHHIGKGQTIR